MALERLQQIREQEKIYHDECYENQTLFQSGSWLERPVKTVLDMFELLNKRSGLCLLDLGCGVGRNSIPLAQHLLRTGGKVVCVDLLDSAIRHLERYGRQYNVAEVLEPHLSDISDFMIVPNDYDYIFSVSSLEHLDSKLTLDRVLTSMIEGTREGGIHCLIMSTGVSETIVDTGESLDPMFELLMDTEELLRLLSTKYKGWELIRQTVRPYELEITRDEKQVLLKSDVVTWAARKLR